MGKSNLGKKWLKGGTFIVNEPHNQKQMGPRSTVNLQFSVCHPGVQR